MFLDYGADISAVNERGQNLIHLIAGLSGQGEMCRASLQVITQRNPNLIRKTTEYAETVLHMFNLNPACVHIFIRNGVDINGNLFLFTCKILGIVF